MALYVFKLDVVFSPEQPAVKIHCTLVNAEASLVPLIRSFMAKSFSL